MEDRPAHGRHAHTDRLAASQVSLGDNGEAELGDIDQTLKKLAGAGFTAIHVKLHDGQTEENAGLPARIRDRAKALGITMLVGGWGQNRQDAHADAEKAMASSSARAGSITGSPRASSSTRATRAR